jgi:hypothetical protein
MLYVSERVLVDSLMRLCVAPHYLVASLVTL